MMQLPWKREWKFLKGLKAEFPYDPAALLLGESVTGSVMSSSVDPQTIARQAPRPWNSPGKNNEWEPFPFPGDLANPGIKPRQILYHLSHQAGLVYSGLKRKEISTLATSGMNLEDIIMLIDVRQSQEDIYRNST